MSCWPGIGPRAGNAEKLRRPGAGGHPERHQGPVPVRAKPGEQLVEHRVRDLLRNPLRDLRAEQARLLLRERLHRVVVRVRPTRPGQRERVHDRPGPGLQVIGVEAAADRLAVRHRRRREPRRRRPLPRHHLGRGRLPPGLPASWRYRQKSRASTLVAWSHGTSTAHVNRNQRSSASAYDRCVVAGRPVACRSRRNSDTGTTRPPPGPLR